MKRMIILFIIGILLCTPAVYAQEAADGQNPGSAGFGADRPDYTGMTGYAFVSAEQAKFIESNPKLQDKKTWKIPIYERSGDGWVQTGTMPHKTEVTVLEQYLTFGGPGSVSGYLLVEKRDDRQRFYLDVENYISKEHRYKAQNGTVIYYFLYLPETKNPAEKLPMLIYFHGNRDTMEKHHGVGELIRANQTEPEGIVMLPQAVNETKDADFHSGRYQEAVLELAKEIAREYNGDMNRLSVSGHSDGGTVTYKIVNRFPGTFAACAPISGIGNTDKGIRQTYLYVFQGAKDFYVKPNVGLRVVLKCENAGCHAMHYIYKNEGHDIQTMVYQDTFPDENGNEVKLIDWLMSKELNQ